MLSYARSLAERRGIPRPPETETDFHACRRFIDAHVSQPQQRPGTGSSGARKGKEPTDRAARRGSALRAPGRAAARRQA